MLQKFHVDSAHHKQRKYIGFTIWMLLCLLHTFLSKGKVAYNGIASHSYHPLRPKYSKLYNPTQDFVDIHAIIHCFFLEKKSPIIENWSSFWFIPASYKLLRNLLYISEFDLHFIYWSSTITKCSNIGLLKPKTYMIIDKLMPSQDEVFWYIFLLYWPLRTMGMNFLLSFNWDFLLVMPLRNCIQRRFTLYFPS